MGAFVGINDLVYLGQTDLTGFAHMVNFGDLTREMKDSTTFLDGGYHCVVPGQMTGAASLSGNQDFSATGVDQAINGLSLGSQLPFTVIPNPSGTVAAGDPAWMSRGVIDKVNPMDGAKGDVGKFMFDIAYDTAILQAKSLHPLAARTATGTGTAVAMAGPTAAQSLFAAIHVTAYSGFTNVVFIVESDDNSGFSSPITRITFSTVTGVTSQFASVAGSFVSETYHRIKYTVTGTGSVSFVVAAGVI